MIMFCKRAKQALPSPDAMAAWESGYWWPVTEGYGFLKFFPDGEYS